MNNRNKYVFLPVVILVVSSRCRCRRQDTPFSTFRLIFVVHTELQNSILYCVNQNGKIKIIYSSSVDRTLNRRSIAGSFDQNIHD